MLELILLTALAAGEADSLNAKVVAFARSNLGEQVGNGQCATLAVEALCAAGAGRPRGGSAWGKELASVRDAQPGDIVQFENAVFENRQRRSDGALVTLTARYPHHTAIVAAVRKRGRRMVIDVLHQNASVGDDDPLSKRVQQWTIDLAALRQGTLTVYRPIADRP